MNRLGVSVTGGEHTVTLDPSAGSGQALALIADDPAPLLFGGITFEVLGEATAEFDDLALTEVGEVPPPVEAAPTSTLPPAQPTAPPEAAPTPATASVGGEDLCGGAAALPLALLGLVWINGRRR